MKTKSILILVLSNLMICTSLLAQTPKHTSKKTKNTPEKTKQDTEKTKQKEKSQVKGGATAARCHHFGYFNANCLDLIWQDGSFSVN